MGGIDPWHQGGHHRQRGSHHERGQAEKQEHHGWVGQLIKWQSSSAITWSCQSWQGAEMSVSLS